MAKEKKRRARRFVGLFWQAFGAYRIQIIVLIFLGFLSGFFEAIGVNMLIPLLSFFSGDGAGGDDFISQFIEKMFVFANIPFTLPSLLIFISLLFFFKALMLLLFAYVRAKINSKYEQDTRELLLKNTLKSAWPHLLKQKLGHLETLLMVNVNLGAKLFAITAEMMMMITSLFMYLLVAVNISYTVTAITLGAGALVFIAIKPLLFRVRAIAKRAASLNKEVAHHVSESILGAKTVKIMSKENIFIQKGSGYFNQLRGFQIKFAIISALSSVFIQPLSVVLISFIFAFSFYLDPNYSFAALAALIYLIHRIFSYIQMLQGNVQSVNKLLPYLVDVLSYKNNSLSNQEDISASKPFQFDSHITFKNVGFSYIPSQEILKNISFRIRKGEMVGFIGKSGAGKTTVFDLVLRLFKPSAGDILLDDVSISEINLTEWRKRIGYVSQDVFLINNTIANNISFFDKTVNNDDIIQAAKTANIYDFIKRLPNGFETIVGERGIHLSVGQRQRIVIARALAKKPEILLLDEATSALDNESEIEIHKALINLKGKMTIVVIAHRLSTITNSDNLFVLEDGKITEEGFPQKLLEDKKSYFYKMYNIRK